ncbi:hypothetical protein [Geosporobacter ferrireducens]|uniref:WYL domain-containing protein n=1 Tax=Geosporobacter ferrireducens TaxID=1424294 RepID=A0A1D8GJ68_9FIRM|nr:hypothetical protein [Geosporobacter ferrireducens]AOT70961.1 hypothetical protein Gferi_16160 [Geosporobacter ferrireducens]MTI53676.1 hypothetical protein [Geosporobacter ferrireducens]
MISQVLNYSIDSGLPITIIYQGKNEITKRKIKVLSWQGETIRAYCCLRKECRVFHTNGILAAVIYDKKTDAGQNQRYH